MLAAECLRTANCKLLMADRWCLVSSVRCLLDGGRWKVAGGVLGATSTLAWQMLRWWGGCATTENSHWGEIWRLFVNVNENVSCDLQILSAVGLGKEGYKGCLPPPAPEGCS